MRRTALLAIAAIALSAAVTARADVPAEGVYVTQCLPTVTCSGEIRKVGKNRYSFDWVATDRTGKTTFCRYKADLKVGTGKHRDGPIPGVLVGKLPGSKLEVLVDAMPGDQVWMYVDGVGDVCPDQKLPKGMRGIIGMNGFYDMEQGDI